jgi:hypothetical protein
MLVNHKCLECKGRYPEKFCHMNICPLYAKISSYKKIEGQLKSEEFDSSSKTPFVSRFGYPNISVGVLAPPGVEDASEYDAPRNWAKNEYQIPKILELRSAMVNSRFPALAKGGGSKELESAQELTMAERPVGVDVTLKRKPSFKITLRPEVTPMGPSADLEKIELTENPRVPKEVERAVSDGELKAVDAISEMKGADEGYITRLLSVGLLGMKKDRKLVPTRWAITATDDTVGKLKIQKIRDYKHADPQAFLGGYLGNYYLIMLMPGIFSYELFEMFAVPDTEPEYVTDWEDYSGRKDYASHTAGGYYATRLAVAERLLEMKRQGSVLVLRFLTEDYSIPLGVWVVREATRKALERKPIQFADTGLMLVYAKLLAKRKFGVGVEHILKASKLLDTLKHQRTLDSFAKI